MLSLLVLAAALTHCVPSTDLTSQQVSVTGVSSVAVRVKAPPGIEAIAIANPFGVDIQLEGVGSPGNSPQRSDNPVRRLGPRLLIVRAGFLGEVDLKVIGKERQGHGTVMVQVAPLTRCSCTEALRLIAAADAHYANAENGVGDAQAEYRAAAIAYESAAVSPLYAEALLAAAAVRYQDASDWQQAAEDAAQAQSALRSLGDPYGAARAAAILAGADMELALAERTRSGAGAETRLADVHRRFMELATFHERRGELFDQALALNNAGLSDHYAGRFARGIRAFHAARAIDHTLGEHPREAQVLQNIALLEYELGRYREACRDYARAAAVLGPDPHSELPGDILNNEALAEYAAGDLDKALEHYGEALNLLETAQVPLQVARSLHGIGIVYYAAGDREQALQYFQRALAMRSAEHDARGRTATLRAMASVLSDLGRKGEAITLRREALASAASRSMRVRIEAQLALDLESTGAHTDAIETVNLAIADSADTPRAYQALARTMRARLELDQGLLDAAWRDCEGALSRLEHTEAATDEFNALVLAGQIARARGANLTADAFLDRALKLAEALRVESANPELRAGIWQGLKGAFDLKIELTAEDRSALTVAERYRARSLADYWRSMDPQAQGIRSLYGQIADRRSQLEIRLERSGQNDPRSRALEADIARLRREVDSAHRTTAAQARSAQELARIAEMIPPDAAVIEYWLGATKARAWVITRQAVEMVRLGESSALERSARALHQSLRSFASDDRSHLIASLSHQVIPQAALRYHTLIFIPDGALHYVPFAVLTAPGAEGSRHLIEHHVIVTAPSLGAALWEHPKVPASNRVLIVSDPAYSPKGKFAPLPGSAVEATAIAKFFDSGELDQLSRLEASRTRFLERDLSGYRVIHIAAHAVTDTQAPLLSALILSTRDAKGAEVPGQVFAGELTAQRLGAELLVLSACDTALGKEVMGEGLLGLRYAAHAAGAESVIASLWEASDRATTEIMQSFYAHYEKDREPAALALAKAMRELQARFPDPSLWGAFEISATGRASMFAMDQHRH